MPIVPATPNPLGRQTTVHDPSYCVHTYAAYTEGSCTTGIATCVFPSTVRSRSRYAKKPCAMRCAMAFFASRGM